MSYQVLARKWRPGSFGDMVGQEHVLRALINALDQDRLHHAYLFTGTRGVGKTTVARIFAKSLNCETGITSKPCGSCSACTEISEGRFLDLIEVDAASRTKVEDTRELLENVQYTPTRGRFKVYLIDEVHMLSAHSFNALLKTLEEPPPHVKFLLATTNPKKLPITILSRCLQFHLKRLPVDLIAPYLEKILEQEKIPAEVSGLHQLAQSADGSMRDALSLLDQAIAYGGGEIKAAEVRSMLGIIDQRHAYDFVSRLAAGDATGVLQKVAEVAEQVSEFAPVLEDVLSLLQRIAIAQALGDSAEEGSNDRERVIELATQLTPEDVQLYYQIALTGRRDLPLAPNPRGGFEMILLRMLAFRPVQVDASVSQPVASKPAKPDTVKPDTVKPDTVKPDTVKPEPVKSKPVQAVEKSVEALEEKPVKPVAAPPLAENAGWTEIIEASQLKGMVREFAANCVFVGKKNDVVALTLDPVHEHLKKGSLVERLEQALQKYYQAPIRLQIAVQEMENETPAQQSAREQEEKRQDAIRSIEGDSNIQALKETFSARVETDSIQPLNK